MAFRRLQGWRCTALSPRCKSALCGALAGAVLSLVLVAGPLWLIGGGRTAASGVGGAAPLAALSTVPAESSQFDISGLLVGDWIGEMCDDEGEPVPIRFEFVHDQSDDVYYSLSLDGVIHSQGTLGNGACEVEGEDVAFHTFLAILNDCDDACGVDRVYEGHFEEGALAGSYTDAVMDEACASCVGGGTWWLEPAAVTESDL
ncbi:MAG: hypothetical protein GY788_16900 [bacterium]|nr:hypothetical protein [bacterium]